ncbi:MAG: ATP-binding protein, partial [Rhodothermales bacterium]|nr:ATP-binding protein [Rhodothermales bacterium]
PILDLRLLQEHDELIGQLVRPLFPSSDWTSDARALSGPFGGHMLYRTHRYEQAMGRYLEERMDIINVHDHYLRTLYAYKAILGRFYGIPLNLDQPLIFVIPHEETGLNRYYKLNASTQFVTLELCGPLPTLTEEDVDALLQNVGDMARWQATIPPALFRFVGLTVTTLTDVTHETATATITNLLLTSDAQPGAPTFDALQSEVRTLLRDANIRLGLASSQGRGAPDFRAEQRGWNSLLIGEAVREGRLRWEGTLYERALGEDRPIVVRDVAEGCEVSEALRAVLLDQGVRSLMLQPLRYEDRPVGLLELSSPAPRAVDAATTLKARRIEPILALAIHVANSTAELKQSLADLKATQAQLVQQEKMASLGALTAGIAHEIKNPLNFVTNFAEINTEIIEELREALEGGSREEIDAILMDLHLNTTKIQEHGRRADAIVHAMMQHARDGSAELERVDLNALVADYVALAYHGQKAQIADFEAEIELDLDRAVGDVELVPQEIGRVVLNLVSNALDAMRLREAPGPGPAEPTLWVSTRRVDDRVEIRVKDNGPGIPADVCDQIFEPFFTTKPAGQGTGLGLSLSYDIVTQGHRGTLTVESEEGQGATFILTLPLSQTSAASRP